MDTLVGGYHAAGKVLCAELAARYPDHPAALYARASALYAHMLDLEDSVGRGEFMALTERVVHVCEEWQQQGRGKAAELAFLKGSALSSRGLLLHHEGKTLAGLRQLISAKGAFDDAIEVDPTFYDAYLGRGAYRYGVAQNASAVSWLPFIPSAASGWDDLWVAVHRARFSRWSALTAIVWFTLDDRKFELADSICAAGLARFPRSRNFLFPKLSLLVKRERWAEAESVAQELLSQYLALPENNGYEAIGLYWRLMKLADELGRPHAAAAYARAGLATHRTPDVAQRRREKLHDLEARLAR